jgi:hypothetical protein
VEELRVVEFAALAPRNRGQGGLVDLFQPAPCGLALGESPADRVGPDRAVVLEVVQHSACLVFLHVETGQRLEAATMVAGLDDLHAQANLVPALDGLQVHVLHVETELVEPRDACVHAILLVRGEHFLARELDPEGLVAHQEPGCEVDRVEAPWQAKAGGDVHELAGDVLLRDLQVVRAHPRRQRRMDLGGLGVDEIGRVASCVEPEQRVRQ